MTPNIQIDYAFENFEPYPGLKRVCERRVSILEHHVFKKPEGWRLGITVVHKGEMTHLTLKLESKNRSIEAHASDADDYFAVYRAFNLLQEKLFQSHGPDVHADSSRRESTSSARASEA